MGTRKRADSGLYQLVIQLKEARVIEVGRLGRFSFPAGRYVYTGSAKKGLESRIARHLRRRKKLRWHIDYLLRSGRIVEVKRFTNCSLSECELSQQLGKVRGGKVVAEGFGSSDCECTTHLHYFDSW